MKSKAELIENRNGHKGRLKPKFAVLTETNF
jgi:hypothetical protein